MTDRLIILVHDPDDDHKNSTTCRVKHKTMMLVNDLCSKTGRSQLEIESMLIEWAYDRTDIEDNGCGGDVA